MSKKKTNSERRNTYLVLHKNPEDYRIFDLRSNRPIGYREDALNLESGSMIVQEVDTIEFSKQPKKAPNTFEYFSPNNIGMLLSPMQKSIEIARKIYLECLNPDKFNHTNTMRNTDLDKKEYLYKNSIILYDYIEQIQTAIVFGYTALEAFTNLSIPIEYEYTSSRNSKGIIEKYDKQAIERWLPLKTKISKILTDVYQTTDITKLKLWSKFLKYEEMRHDIIHQKSISETDFYKKYLDKNIFDVCNIPVELIQYFYDNLEKQNRTNLIWPWVAGRENTVPISTEFNPENFELLGNIYENK